MTLQNISSNSHVWLHIMAAIYPPIAGQDVYIPKNIELQYS